MFSDESFWDFMDDLSPLFLDGYDLMAGGDFLFVDDPGPLLDPVVGRRQSGHKVPRIDQLDRSSSYARIRQLKKWKNRIERRRAKINPECVANYGRYQGYES